MYGLYSCKCQLGHCIRRKKIDSNPHTRNPLYLTTFLQVYRGIRLGRAYEWPGSYYYERPWMFHMKGFCSNEGPGVRAAALCHWIIMWCTYAQATFSNMTNLRAALIWWSRFKLFFDAKKHMHSLSRKRPCFLDSCLAQALSWYNYTRKCARSAPTRRSTRR